MAFTELVAGVDRAAQKHLGGQAVVYRPEFGAPVTVQGIFDDQYVLLSEGETGVESRGLAVSLVLADLPVHPDDDNPTITISGTEYRVVERKPGGMGLIVLVLHRVT